MNNNYNRKLFQLTRHTIKVHFDRPDHANSLLKKKEERAVYWHNDFLTLFPSLTKLIKLRFLEHP